MLGIPVSKYPEITPPMVQVTAFYNGANAVNMEEAVATPLEQQINGVEGMLYMKSINANNGSTSIQVSFDVGTDLDKVNMLTQNKVAAATPFLPSEVKNIGVNVKKSLTFPLVLVSMYSKTGVYDASFINNYAFINVLDELKRIKGVGDVAVMGGAEYAMRVWVKPDRLAALNITVNDVIRAMREQNNIMPGGTFGDQPAGPDVRNTYTALLQSRLVSEEEFGKIVLKSNSNGAQVRLKDVARVELGLQTYSVSSYMDGFPSSTIAVYQIPGSNGIEVANQVRKKWTKSMPGFRKG